MVLPKRFVYVLRSLSTPTRYYTGVTDGKSKGTVNNVVNLSREHKPIAIYVAPTKRFRTVKSIGDLEDLLAEGDSGSVERIVNELHLSVVPHRAAG